MKNLSRKIKRAIAATSRAQEGKQSNKRPKQNYFKNGLKMKQAHAEKF